MADNSTNQVEASTINKLGLGDLVALAAGQVIGAGVVTLVGQAIGLTGRSAWVAYATAVILGFVIIIPYMLLSSMIRVKGGNYSFVSSVLGEQWGGVYGMAFSMNIFACGMFGLAFASYFDSLVPGLNQRLVAVVIITVFYLANIIGVNFMAKVQGFMSIALFLGLGLYIVMGFTKLRPGTFAFGSAEFFTNGFSGFIAAVMILVFSCTGHSFVVSYSRDAKNARRDIPLAMIIATGIILVLYTSVALVTGGVLPIEEAAGKPLTVVAREIMGGPLSIVFVIGGPLMALATTLNSSFGAFSRPILQMARDGWFPKKLASVNKQEAPYLVLTVLYLMSVVPVAAGLSIPMITGNAVLISRISDIVALIAILLLPNKLPDAWENRYLKMSKSAHYALVGFCLLTNIVVAIFTMTTLTPTLIIVTISLVVIFIVYSMIRQKTGKVQVEKSYELQ